MIIVFALEIYDTAIVFCNFDYFIIVSVLCKFILLSVVLNYIIESLLLINFRMLEYLK